MIKQDEYNGKKVVTTLTAFHKDGKWKVIQEIEQSRKLNLEDDWEVSRSTATAYNEDLGEALSDVTLTLMTYLKAVDGDLFNKYGGDNEQNSD